jgi:hypothetical protein
MIPKTLRVRRAICEAIELRATGKPWADVAKTVNRKVRTVQNWQRRYADYYQAVQRETDCELAEETAREIVYILRQLFRDKADGDQIKAATLLVRMMIERQKIDLRAMEAGILRPCFIAGEIPAPEEHFPPTLPTPQRAGGRELADAAPPKVSRKKARAVLSFPTSTHKPETAINTEENCDGSPSEVLCQALSQIDLHDLAALAARLRAILDDRASAGGDDRGGSAGSQ